jgi:hypothetical protein
MLSIEILFSLIRAMSKSEKRYLRILSAMQKGEKSYMALFDTLEKYSVNDEKVQAELQRIYPGSSIEPARKHLYRVVMRSLRQFDSEKDIETRLANLLQDSRILYTKGLLNQSLEQLERAKQLAISHEKFLHYILAARQELQYLVRTQFEGIDEYQLIEKQKKIKEFLEQENKVSQYSMLYEILLLRYWKNGMVRSQQEVTQLNDLLLEEYQLLNSRGEKSFEWQQIHLHFQSIYFQMTGNPKGSLNVFYELDLLFQKNEFLWKDAPLSYFHLLDGILNDLRWMGRYEEMPFFMDRMKAISSSGDSLNLLLRYGLMEHKLNQLVDQGEFAAAHEILKGDAANIEREAIQLPFHMHGQLMFAVVRVWLNVGNYSAALKVINNILNQPVSATNPSLHTLFQLMNLMVNALMNNRDYLHYAIRSIDRKLKSERKLHDTEQLILTVLKRWVVLKPVKELEERLALLSQNPFEHQLIKELCLPNWLVWMKLAKRTQLFSN